MAGTSTVNEAGLDVCERIITEVQKHPALYDPASRGYHDANLKENLWVAIATRLDMDEQVCRKKWRNLRDQYMKKKRKLKTVSGQAASKMRKWRYMEIMQFLNSLLADRETESKLSPSFEREERQEQSPSVEDAASENEEEADGDADSEMGMASTATSRSEMSPQPQLVEPSPSSAPPSVSERRQFKRQRTNKNDFEEMLQEYFKHKQRRSMSTASSTTSTPKDEDEYFMLSCVPTLKTLSAYRKMELKCKIQQLLLEFTPREVSADRATPSTPV